MSILMSEILYALVEGRNEGNVILVGMGSVDGVIGRKTNLLTFSTDGKVHRHYGVDSSFGLKTDGRGRWLCQ